MKQKVVILVNSLLAGGAERFVSILLNSLANDLEIHLLVLENLIEYELPSNQIVVDLGSSGVRSADLRNLLRLPFVANRLRKYCNEKDIPLVISFLNRPNLAACLAKRLGMKACVLISERVHTASSYKQNDLRGKVGGFLISTFYPLADAILPNSKGTQRALEQIFKVKNEYIVIRNAILLDDIRAKKDEIVDDVRFDRFTFVCVAGFRSQKNHRMLVESFARLENTDTQLLLIGTGYKLHGEGYKVLSEIKEMVISLGLGERVLFLGQKENPFKYLSRADCFVLSSNFEGFPNVLIEAMACGLPIISTDCLTGPREILAPETIGQTRKLENIENGESGMLVPVGNVSIMAAAMEEMIRNKELKNRFKTKGEELALQYDREIVMQDFRQIVAKFLPPVGEHSPTS